MEAKIYKNPYTLWLMIIVGSFILLWFITLLALSLLIGDNLFGISTLLISTIIASYAVIQIGIIIKDDFIAVIEPDTIWVINNYFGKNMEFAFQGIFLLHPFKSIVMLKDDEDRKDVIEIKTSQIMDIPVAFDCSDGIVMKTSITIDVIPDGFFLKKLVNFYQSGSSQEERISSAKGLLKTSIVGLVTSIASEFNSEEIKGSKQSLFLQLVRHSFDDDLDVNIKTYNTDTKKDKRLKALIFDHHRSGIETENIKGIQVQSVKISDIDFSDQELIKAKNKVHRARAAALATKELIGIDKELLDIVQVEDEKAKKVIHKFIGADVLKDSGVTAIYKMGEE